MNDRFGSTARDFAAGIVTREGGTPEDVRELSYGPDLDRIVSDHRAEFDWNTVPGVYGQINVYSVTTKSERYERSYWTRTAAGNGIGGRKAPVPYGS